MTFTIFACSFISINTTLHSAHLKKSNGSRLVVVFSGTQKNKWGVVRNPCAKKMLSCWVAVNEMN
jgi:hypothetical protein